MNILPIPEEIKFTNSKVTPIKTLNTPVSISRSTKFVSAVGLLRGINKMNIKNFSLPKMILVQGSPGCGKTQLVIDRIKNEVHIPNRHLILTTTREAAADFRRRAGLTDKSVCRTGDSYLMSGKFEKVHTLWVDECCMKHPGEIVWYINACRPTLVILLGDQAQIPYDPRMAGVNLKFTSFSNWDVELFIMDTTFRLPIDTTLLINELKFYPFFLRTTKTLKKSMQTKIIPGLTSIPNYDRDTIYLTLTQFEKEEVKKRFSNVWTVHEFQGSQSARVILIRINNKIVPIYESRPHLLVAISRHYKEFFYFTVVSDFLYKTINDFVPKFKTKVLVNTASNDAFDRSLAFNKLKIGGGRRYKQMLQDQDKSNLIAIYDFLTPENSKHILHINRDVRHHIERQMGNFVIPATPSFIYLEDISSTILHVPYTPTYCVEHLQSLYTSVFPEVGHLDDRHLQFINENSHINFALSNVKFNLDIYYKYPKFDTLQPVLKTITPRPIAVTSVSVMKAFFERNGCAPDYIGDVAFAPYADRLVSNFVDTFIQHPDFHKFKELPVEMNHASLEEWMKTQPTNIMEALLAEDLDFVDIDLTRYEMIMKRLPKIILEPDAPQKFSSPQTIAFLNKTINSIFCPIVKVLKQRLRSVLRENFILYSDMSHDEFLSSLNRLLPPHLLSKFQKFLEIDFSKYDKSQGYLSLLFEVKIMQLLGFPSRLIPYWIWAHVNTSLMERRTQFKAYVQYQRKSGDAMTFFGNTLLLMAIIADTIDLRHSIALFSGDDSYIFSLDDTIDQNLISNKMATVFNMEIKLIQKRIPYFCSRFLVPVSDVHWAFVPDLIKLIAKMGRHDLVNFIHAEEYRRSTFDLLKPLENEFIYDSLNIALNDRYNLTGDHSSAYRTLITFVSDSALFRSLYYVEDGAVLGVFNSLTDFDF